MARLDEVRQGLEAAGINLDDDATQRLAAGEEVEIAAEAGDCCPAGWIGIGHRPRFCIKPEVPPKLKVCWG
jgi:hypothetical protein